MALLATKADREAAVCQTSRDADAMQGLGLSQRPALIGPFAAACISVAQVLWQWFPTSPLLLGTSGSRCRVGPSREGRGGQLLPASGNAGLGPG